VRAAGLRLLEELLDFDEEELREERERLVAIPESESSVAERNR
jgi:hypothetical protein